MGYSRWEEKDYTSYVKTTGYTTRSREEVFASRNMKDSLNPAKMMVNHGPSKGQTIRESIDSNENPNSTPIIIGLDVTGSMGFVAEFVAKEALPALMGKIYETKPVSDPHLLFCGIGDVYSDEAPLQVSQFEPDIKILEQLRDLWLEGNGGGNNTESYDLPWHFAAFNTSTDAWNKRKAKGYLFTIGDEMPPTEPLSTSDIKKVYGNIAGDLPSGLTTKELLKAVQERYQVFHIVAEQGSYARQRLQKVRSAWKDLMGPNAIFMKDCKDFTEIVLATLRISNLENMNEVIKTSNAPEALKYAFDVDKE